MIDLNINVETGHRLVIEADSVASAQTIVESLEHFEFHQIFENENIEEMDKVRIDNVVEFHAQKSGGVQLELIDGKKYEVGGFHKEGPVEVISMY
jgi:hypothetical protein